MGTKELAQLKRDNVLPLKVSLWLNRMIRRKKELNQCCDVPYWLALFPPLLLVMMLLMLNGIQNGARLPWVTVKLIVSTSTIIFIQLLASEAVNRKVIHTFISDITPPVIEETIWTKIDISIRKQVLFALLGVVVGLPVIVSYSREIFPSVKLDLCFVVGLAIVLFNTSYGMLMHVSSSMSLVHMSTHFESRLYEFFPTGSPVIRHLANLYSTALLITILTSIATVSIVVLIFPSPVMFNFATISLISAIGVAISAFLYHISSINELIDKGKEKAIAKIQDRIRNIQADYRHSNTDGGNSNALEEVGKLLDLSEKIQNAKSHILSINVILKYTFSILSPVLSLTKVEYLDALKGMADALADLL